MSIGAPAHLARPTQPKRPRAPRKVRADRRKRSRLKVVAQPKRPNVRARRLVSLVASLAVVGLLVFAIVLVQTVVSQSSFRMEELQRRNAQLEQQYGRLRLQVAELSAPDRIAAEARKLGLRLPDQVQTLYVKGVPQSTGSRPEPPSFALKGTLEEDP